MSLLDPIRAEATALANNTAELKKQIQTLQAQLAAEKAKPSVDPADVQALVDTLKAANAGLLELVNLVGAA